MARREPAGYRELLESNAAAPEPSGFRGQNAIPFARVFLELLSANCRFASEQRVAWLQGEKMRSKFIPLIVCAAFAVAVALPLAAQSYPSAKQGGWPVMIGGGMSVFNMDFPAGEDSHMEGETIWADWTKIPFVPRQLGIDAEFRKLSMNPPSFDPGLRSKIFLGGPVYTWTFSRFAVYGKGMIGYASIDFSPFGSYSHDTRTIRAAAGGGEYRVWNSIWARADYEYQWWPNLASGHPHPNGVTFGLAYDFHTIGRQY